MKCYYQDTRFCRFIEGKPEDFLPLVYAPICMICRMNELIRTIELLRITK